VLKHTTAFYFHALSAGAFFSILWHPKDMKSHGQCFCGAVQYQIELNSKAIVHCHCSMCRQIHGAPYVTWVGGVTSTLELTTGRDSLKYYKSSANARRGFCSKCGCPMFFESTDWPGETSMPLPHIRPPHDLKPRAHIYFSDKEPGLEIHDDLPKYGGKTGLEPLAPDTLPYSQ
jgi:hypothetical protein